MKKEEQIRQEIFSKIKELYCLRQQREDVFIPGSTPVHYGGRVYDEKEMISLIDASLDFWLTAGKYAERFEIELSEFLGVDHCILTNSGSSANLLAISALTSRKLGNRRLNPGDEVITPACGFPTTLNPIIQNNLLPVLVDVRIGSYNIDTGLLQEAISKRTRALIIPHTLGNPADIGCILDLVEDHELWFIEDNCDALGSKYKGRYTGTFGHLSTCSFYPAHHITMGEGGAVLTSDPMLKKIVLSFRDWGRDCWCDPGCDNSCGKRFGWELGTLPFGYDHRYTYSHIGYNLKVTDMQAAIGVEQLKKLPEFIEIRKANFNYLYNFFERYEDIMCLPEKLADADPSWFGFPLLVKTDAPFSRNEIVQHLENNKISTRMLFGGNLVRQPAYQDVHCITSDSLANSDMVMNNLFWIGVYPGLKQEQLQYITSRFDAFFSQYREM